MKRYRCPRCGRGRNAPDTLDSEDSRGYCFACSDKTGKLVRMIAPAIEAQKAKRAETRKRQHSAKREAQARRRWEREHTWPGVREVRLKKWGPNLRTDSPRVQGVSTIPHYYVELWRLTFPPAATGDVEGERAQLRERVMKRVGLPEAVITRLKWGHDHTAWTEACAFVRANSITWMLDDLGITHPEGRSTIEFVILRTDLSRPDDVSSLNTIILNAFAVGKAQESNVDERDLEGA